ncbi:DUF4381 domain-containing protein [Marinicella litoralis]|uniref:Uncharacterized protein DUF4381 n=1 Tax=Marinicella litoralis TaxID=644220 RepID=A0A4R6XYB4_9GAMM|nr:DUF4381 domain-containing protein [Marinicella litoralis]TDR23629.1 uncharacterized protein DUF4381 [Marinicella litoralis]
MQANEIPALPLRDIKLPAEPGFWPLAPGWWLLLVLSLLLLTWLAVKWYRYVQKKRRWQQIEHQLAEIELQFKQSNNKQNLLAEISVFLRRFVKFQLQQKKATTLAGQQWTDHLNQLQQEQPFLPFEQALTTGVYQHNFDYDATELLKTTRQFIKQHVMKPAKPQTQEVANV